MESMFLPPKRTLRHHNLPLHYPIRPECGELGAGRGSFAFCGQVISITQKSNFRFRLIERDNQCNTNADINHHSKTADLELDLKIERGNINISWEKERNYQNAVTLKKVLEDAMETIEPAAKIHCPILRRSPVTVPGVPAKFCIFIFPAQRKPSLPRWATGELHLPSKTRKLTTGKCLTQSTRNRKRLELYQSY